MVRDNRLGLLYNLSTTASDIQRASRIVGRQEKECSYSSHS